MHSEPTTVDKLRALPWSIASNAAQSVYLQLTFFGSVFVLFLNSLGLDNVQIGFLLSLLPFTGILSLALAPAIARVGYKRTWLTFFGLRTFVTAFLLLTPVVVERFGSEAAMGFITVVVLVYALVRTVGVSAGFPWTQEYVPNSVRGKYTASNNFYSTIAGFVAVTTAALVLERAVGLTGYMVLIAIGVLFGFISVALAWRIPGGAPVKPDKSKPAPQRNIKDALRDSHMLRYLAGVGLFTLATVPLGAFLPLFMQDQVGLSTSQVVLLQTGAMVGALVSSYFWGWASDRYGGRPVTLYGLAFRALLPAFWMLLPAMGSAALPAANAIAVLQGFADVGWQVGATRLLYVSIVPPAKRDDYMAVYWAWVGLVSGFSQLFGGWLLTATENLSGMVAGIPLDPYTPLFLLGIVLPIAAIFVLRRIRDDTTMGMGGFAGIFLRGNPFLALEAVVRFHLAKDEEAAVRVTERLGASKSPLTVEELLAALEDPRFNVRIEAVIATAHHGPDPRLIDAVAEVLNGPEPALSTIAAWALGRMGDARGLEPLRQAAHDSKYRSVRAHSIRSLGVLGDQASVPLALEGVAEESDVGMLLAYASMLGRMQVTEATDRLLALLASSPSRSSRREMALAVARLAGNENNFVTLLSQCDQEAGTALAQALLTLRKRLGQGNAESSGFSGALEHCARTLARHEMAAGIDELAELLQTLPAEQQAPHVAAIVQEAARRMRQYGVERLEYPVLALHTLTVAWETSAQPNALPGLAL
jgi:HEAT repeat protein/sugar phosphate permease